MNKQHNDKFLEALYSGTSIPDVITRYQDNLEDHSHRTKLGELKHLLQKTDTLKKCRSYFNKAFDRINTELPELPFRIEGRRKSLISVERKIRQLLAEDKSLDLLRDFYAFRITTFKSDMAAVEDCYKIAELLIELFESHDCILCALDKQPSSHDLFLSNAQNLIKEKGIYVPKTNLVLKHRQNSVKDYIFNPKDNGYQSLHLTFRLPSYHCVEIQIRTLRMHTIADSGVAAHSDYKLNKYSDISFDPLKINIDGYSAVNDGQKDLKIYDLIGLSSHLSVLLRSKTSCTKF